MNNQYTVVMLVPDEFTDNAGDPETYTAIGIHAATPREAFFLAEEEAKKEYLKEGYALDVIQSTRFKKLLVFEGSHAPKMYGWQL